MGGLRQYRYQQLERGCRPCGLTCLDARLGDWDPGAGSGQTERMSTAIGAIHLVRIYIYTCMFPPADLCPAQPEKGTG